MSAGMIKLCSGRDISGNNDRWDKPINCALKWWRGRSIFKCQDISTNLTIVRYRLKFIIFAVQPPFLFFNTLFSNLFGQRGVSIDVNMHIHM